MTPKVQFTCELIQLVSHISVTTTYILKTLNTCVSLCCSSCRLSQSKRNRQLKRRNKVEHFVYYQQYIFFFLLSITQPTIKQRDRKKKELVDNSGQENYKFEPTFIEKPLSAVDKPNTLDHNIKCEYTKPASACCSKMAICLISWQ